MCDEEFCAGEKAKAEEEREWREGREGGKEEFAQVYRLIFFFRTPCL